MLCQGACVEPQPQSGGFQSPVGCFLFFLCSATLFFRVKRSGVAYSCSYALLVQSSCVCGGVGAV